MRSFGGGGLSSDGKGGITRPEVGGQRLALARAYRRAGYGVDSVGYFEGHGTGTALGDATELQTLVAALEAADRDPQHRAPVLGTIKALIGHTKAAAGIAGLIKATMVVHHRILPPTAGQTEPHPILAETTALRTLRGAEAWPAGRPVRASVSAMGFGGINAHVTLAAPEASVAVRRLRSDEARLVASAQDAELLVFDADDRAGLVAQLTAVAAYAPDLSLAEVSDLAAALASAEGQRRQRAAVVARTADDLGRSIAKLLEWIDAGIRHRVDPLSGAFLALPDGPPRTPRIGLLFPGQGSPAHLDGGIWRRRFEAVARVYDVAQLPDRMDGADTAVAQPAIVTASWAAVALLEDLGLVADVAVGHSLGELSALAWAGALSEGALLRTARARGEGMARLGSATGAMAAIEATGAEVSAMVACDEVQISCFNAPDRTVISGRADAVEAVLGRARAEGWVASRLRVSHAFHSPAVAGAAPVLAAHLGSESLRPPTRRVVSTVTGSEVPADANVAVLLTRGVVEPVRFEQALRAVGDVDLFLEVGPGHALGALAPRTVDVPVVSLDAGGSSLRGLLCGVASAWALGARIRPGALFRDRFNRPFPLDWTLDVLANPCSVDPVARTPRPDLQLGELRTEVGPPVAPAEARDEIAAPSPDDPLELVRQLVAQRVELPIDAIGVGDRMLSDLHLNSIMVAEIAGEAARRIGVPPLASPTAYANAEVGQLAEALAEIARTGGEAPAASATPGGVAPWVRAFCVQWLPQPRPSVALAPDPAAEGWRVVAPADHPLRDALSAAIAAGPQRDGVIVCLPAGRPVDLDDLTPLLDEAIRLATSSGGAALVLVQSGHGAAGLAKSLHLEAPRIAVGIVDLPIDLPGAVDRIVEEARGLRGFVECRYDADGVRRVPRIVPWSPEGDPQAPLDASDVILVTGGGKGITAECALDLARWTGASLALIGRSDPDHDAVLAGNLERCRDSGARVAYFRCDVLDPAAVRGAIGDAEADLGPITAVIHGAGRNAPELIAGLTPEAMRATFAPKVEGLRHVLAALDPARLRLVVGFGSIIGRSGLRGNADYAVANEWLTAEVAAWGRGHPQTRTLVLEWSVWAGVGMGERLSTVDTLAREGITAITVDEGLAWMRRLLAHPTPSSVVVAGRHGDLPTLRPVSVPAPFLRFVDEIRTWTPGVEIVIDTPVSVATDPYLDDHVFEGQRLLPAVLGFEAMAQAATVLLGEDGPPTVLDAVFRRPVVVPRDRPVTIRVAVLVTGPRQVRAVLRAEDSAFAEDCFSATLRYDADEPEAPRPLPPQADLDIDIVGDVYGSLLFHEGRFRRIEAYQRIEARGCRARTGIDRGRPWFAPYLAPTLLLGDPALMDATIHAHQPAFPHSPLLPRSIAEIRFADLDRPGPFTIVTRETARSTSGVTVDVEVRTLDGHLRARWRGLQLVTVAGTAFDGPWPESVLGAYLEHHLPALDPERPPSAAVSLGGSRPERRERVVMALGDGALRIHHRPDGKPERATGGPISFSHSGDLTLAVANGGTIACDLQRVEARGPAQWRTLLGDGPMAIAEHLTSAVAGLDPAATSVWAALECLQKAGVSPPGALTIRAHRDGWSTFDAGDVVILTRVMAMRRSPDPLVVAVATSAEVIDARSSG